MALLNPSRLRRVPFRRVLRVAGLLALGLLGASGPTARAQTPATPEYQVKAVFLFPFAQFVEWPPKALGGDQAPFVIGVLGEDPFGSYLDEAGQGERIGTHPLVTRRFRRVEDITACHILFISRSEAGHFESLTPQLRSLGILTVADFDDFIRQGGIIQFVTVKNKIRLRINLEAAKGASLMISSKLLRPAMIVVQEPE